MADLNIRVITKYAGQGVRSAGSNLKSLLSDVKGGFADAGGSIGGFNLALAGTTGIVAGAAVAIGAGAIKLSQIGAQAQAAERTFEAISGGAEQATANMLAMDRALRGLASDTEAQNIASKVLGLEIATTASELEEITTIARRLGSTFRGLSAPQAIDELALTLANRSIPRLDSFGIAANNVKERMEELQKSGKDVDTAFKQAFLEEARRTMAKLPPEVESTAEATQGLSAEWQNFTGEIGKLVESTGIVTGFFNELSGGIRNVRMLLGGGDINDQISFLRDQIEDMESARAEQAAGGGSLFDQIFGLSDGDTSALDAQIATMKQSLADLEAERNQIEQAGIAKQEEANQARAEQEKESNDTLKDFKREFARDVLEIERDTNKQLAEAKEDNAEALEDLEEDHSGKIIDIREDAAKDQLRLQKKLQKDLERVDKDLKKDLVDLEQDQQKDLLKAQEDAAKDEQRDRRREKVDALADERLFQFQLRQLQAEGDGAAIQAALERRAIEKEIAEEKAEVESQIEGEKRRDTIKSIREEGQERRAELQAEAAERKAQIEERNTEELASLQERLTEEIAAENENFAERKEDLAEYHAERLADIAASQDEELAELGRGLTQQKELTRTHFDELEALAAEIGPEIGKTLADGITEGTRENFSIEAILGRARGGDPLSVEAQPGVRDIAAQFDNFQGGGRVGGPIGAARPAVVHGGEVIIDPSSGGTINIGGERFVVEQASRLAAAINDQRNRDMQALVDEIADSLQ